ATGLELCARPEKPPWGSGILVFDELSQGLMEFLREICRGGLVRVLAVGVAAPALAGKAGWQLLKAGAADAFARAHHPHSAAEIHDRCTRWHDVERLRQAPEVCDLLVYQSLEMVQLLRQVVEVAAFTQASVLITGESGTGKELLAKLIHALDRRDGKRDLVVLDCAAVVPELAGSEFFGHERGAFTGAVADRDGAFALADGGTLFLDEVGELPLALQAELLRVIQEHTYKRVGSNQWRRTNFRLVCATNRDLP